MASPQPFNILVAGIYRSGSSAVVDYLKGHPDVSGPGGEFTEFKSIGRIGHLLTTSSPEEARRISRRMVWETRLARLPRGWWREHKGEADIPLKYRVGQNRMKLRALKKYRKDLANGHDHHDPRHFRRWMEEIVNTYSAGRRALLLNQPIWIGTHNEVWPVVFDPFKLIVVHRDPMDQFADIVRQGTMGKRRTDPLYTGDHNREDPVGYLLEGLTKKYEALHLLREQLPHDRFLAMPFETFVLKHDQAATHLCQYLGLEESQNEKRRFFPEQSKRNIGIGNNEETRQMMAPYQERLNNLLQLRAALGDPLESASILPQVDSM